MAGPPPILRDDRLDLAMLSAMAPEFDQISREDGRDWPAVRFMEWLESEWRASADDVLVTLRSTKRRSRSLPSLHGRTYRSTVFMVADGARFYGAGCPGSEHIELVSMLPLADEAPRAGMA